MQFASGKVVKIVAMGMDVTEQRGRREEIARLLREAQTFVDMAPAPIFSVRVFLTIPQGEAMMSNARFSAVAV